MVRFRMIETEDGDLGVYFGPCRLGIIDGVLKITRHRPDQGQRWERGAGPPRDSSRQLR